MKDAAAERGGATRFVILCLGRTGSTHLQSMLDFHSQSRCLGEIFGDGEEPTFAAAPEQEPGEFLARIFAPEGELADGPHGGTDGDGEFRAVGFKLPMNSIRLTPAAAELVRSDTSLTVIRLSRRNRLAQLVSRRLLAETGVSQSVFGDYGDATVRLDPDACLAALTAIETEEAELDEIAAGHETFPILYEELGDEVRLRDLQRFLGLDPEPLRSWYERLRTRPLAETIVNWDEVAAALEGTRWERCLSDEG